MKKQNKGIWIIGIIILIVLLGNQLGVFTITGSERMTRIFPAEVEPGANQGINYKVSGGEGKWAASVQEKISCPGHSDVEKKFVIISDVGDSLIVFYQLPDEELVCTLSGTYQFGDKPLRSLPSQSITLKTPCTSQAESKCYLKDIYWYDSCGNREDKKEDCFYNCIVNSNGEDFCGVSLADTNNDGIISRSELGAYINKWIAGEVDRNSLGIAIQIWASQ